MKIVNLEEFRKLPAGTIYAKYEPCVFDGLDSKGDTLEVDFLYDGLIGNIEHDSSEDMFDKCQRMEKGESIGLDFDCTGRDGLFEESQLFAIYEKGDIEKLIGKLNRCLKSAYSEPPKAEEKPKLKEKILNASNVQKIQWDESNLIIHFNNGNVYQYFDIPEKVSVGLGNAESPGSYLHREIKGIYRYSRV